jgi:hypothetical protein
MKFALIFVLKVGGSSLSLPLSITGTEAIITNYGEWNFVKQMNQYILLGGLLAISDQTRDGREPTVGSILGEQ